MPRRRFGRSKRRFKKRYNRRLRRPRFSRKRPTYMFKRCLHGVYDGSSVVTTFSVPGGGGNFVVSPQFKLNDLPGVSELISLYDQYKINAVKLELIPQSNINEFIGETIPYIHSVLDYDDSVLLANVNEAYEYQSLKSTTAFRKHTRYLKPFYLSMGLNSLATTVPVAPKRSWISTAQSSVIHRGVKIIIEDSASANVDLQIRVKTTFYLQFKNVK